MAEVLIEQEQAELAAAKAEVKRVVSIIQNDIRRARMNQQYHLDAATDANGKRRGSIRTADFSDLVSNVRSFARRQPTTFIGITALAGFAARILKCSLQHGSP